MPSTWVQSPLLPFLSPAIIFQSVLTLQMTVTMDLNAILYRIVFNCLNSIYIFFFRWSIMLKKSSINVWRVTSFSYSRSLQMSLSLMSVKGNAVVRLQIPPLLHQIICVYMFFLMLTFKQVNEDLFLFPSMEHPS